MCGQFQTRHPIESEPLNRLLPPPCSQAELQALLHYNPRTGTFTWKISKGANAQVGAVAGYASDYYRIMINGKEYRAHKLAWYYVYGVWILIDHKDCDTLNNRLKNLRPASESQNMCNRRMKRTLDLPKGVSRGRRGVGFRARIMVNRIQHSLGVFQTVDAAALAYKKAAKKLHGEFARVA